MTEEQKKWVLNMGSHDGTVMGRDSSREEYNSLEECKQVIDEAEKSWNDMGRRVWYADAYGPNGEKVTLREVSYYRS